MKALVFLLLLAAVVATFVWRLRKNQEKEELARQKALKRRKQREREAIAPTEDMIWPVIIRPASGEHPHGEQELREEPAMTEIEYTPPDLAALRKEKSAKLAS